MTNKLKLLLLGLITVLTLSISNTYALTFYGYIAREKMISSYNGFAYSDYKNGYLGCIYEQYKSSANFTGDAGCAEGIHIRYIRPSSTLLRIGNYGVDSAGGFSLRNKLESPDVFTILKYTEDDKVKGMKIMIKNLHTKMFQVKSQRGENVYNNAFVDGIGFYSVVKDDDQVRAAHTIANSYTLDGYILAVSQYTSFIIDTYANKLYKYNNNFYSINDQAQGATQIFPKLRNTVPDEIADITRGIGTNKLYYNSNEYKTYDIINKRPGTKQDLAEFRENIKKSIVIHNTQFAEFFLGQTPEELGIGTGTPNTNNQTNTSGSVSHGSEEKKACIDYYTKQKALTAHSDGCFGDGKNDEQMQYWYNVIDGNYEQYNLWDKTRYWRCRQFANYREKLQKEISTFDKFFEEWKSKFLGFTASDVDVNALCSHIVVDQKKEEQNEGSGFINGFMTSLYGFFGQKFDPINGNAFTRLFGITKIGTKSGSDVSLAEYHYDNTNLSVLKAQCENPIIVGVPIWDREKIKAKNCEKYEKELEKLKFKYEEVEYISGYSFPMGSGTNESDLFGLKKIVDYFSKDYNEGRSLFFNSESVCKNGILFKEWDFLVYLPMLFICFYVLKYWL